MPRELKEDNVEIKGGIVIVPGSAHARAMQKHEQWPSRYGDNPGNPYVFRPYPTMMYKAQKWDGKWRIDAQAGPSYMYKTEREHEMALLEAERFCTSCQRIVKTEREHTMAMEDGYRDSPQEAVEHMEGFDRDISNAAAERHAQDATMSPAAQAEALEADRATEDHLPEVPAKSVRKRVKRKKKTTRRRKVAD